jgi:hypothetical protein
MELNKSATSSRAWLFPRDFLIPATLLLVADLPRAFDEAFKPLLTGHWLSNYRCIIKK